MYKDKRNIQIRKYSWTRCTWCERRKSGPTSLTSGLLTTHRALLASLTVFSVSVESHSAELIAAIDTKQANA